MKKIAFKILASFSGFQDISHEEFGEELATKLNKYLVNKWVVKWDLYPFPLSYLIPFPCRILLDKLAVRRLWCKISNIHITILSL